MVSWLSLWDWFTMEQLASSNRVHLSNWICITRLAEKIWQASRFVWLEISRWTWPHSSWVAPLRSMVSTAQAISCPVQLQSPGRPAVGFWQPIFPLAKGFHIACQPTGPAGTARRKCNPSPLRIVKKLWKCASVLWMLFDFEWRLNFPKVLPVLEQK